MLISWAQDQWSVSTRNGSRWPPISLTGLKQRQNTTWRSILGYRGLSRLLVQLKTECKSHKDDHIPPDRANI